MAASAPPRRDLIRLANGMGWFSLGLGVPQVLAPGLVNRAAGITDDAAWNCVPDGDAADLPEEPLPEGLPPCTNPTNHNIKNKPNLFSAMSAAGMSWRIYSESMNPGRDWRLDSAAFWRDETVTIGVAERSPAEIVRLMGHIDAVHGLYYLFMHFWVGAFGPSELSTRFPSAIAVGEVDVAIGDQRLRGEQVMEFVARIIGAVLGRNAERRGVDGDEQDPQRC